MAFSVRSTLFPPIARLRIRGELDLFTAKQVGRRIDDAVEQGCRTVVLDAGGVTFVNGSALGVMIRTLIMLTSTDGSLQFERVSPKFERLCQLTGIDEVLGLTPLTVPDAPVVRGR
jgi:anti-sigma B factor antagonist